MYKCPKCGCESFYVIAHIVQEWVVDKHGSFVDVFDECIEITHNPSNDDIWQCAECGYENDGEMFIVGRK